MTIALSLLQDVRWRGTSVVGDRPRALLAALASRGGRPVSAEELIKLVWADEPPLNGHKSLQVLVSRTRNACGPDLIVRAGTGYRLGAEPGEVDSTRLHELVKDAKAALDKDAATAAARASEALALAAGEPENGQPENPLATAPQDVADDDTGPLAEIRRLAAADVAAAKVIYARAASRMGAHQDALAELTAAHAELPDDEPLLADLLRSEAAVNGPAKALDRYERYRRELRDRLGTDPGEQLQRAHKRLLALDQPVRQNVRYDATELIGRDEDLDKLRALLSSSRVVSIIGAGGLGKTRLAHALARDAAEPVVHFVELVGVTSAEDVVVEIGSVLGVRDSVSGRRVLTREQKADVRARIAQRLDQAPSLLVLDNCEHLIAAVAEFVAFATTATADLHVLITSRAPLAIAAEHAYLLGELRAGDAVRLFRQRAAAARPSVKLPDEIVTSIVTKLDGLPLAIELAAAKVRAMSVEEIDRRLADRFALLRGGDRSAPGRHQTLLAVIDWSWNLLTAAEQDALRRLALFHDGFTLDAAAAVLGGDAIDAVGGLVDQSLLSVAESAGGARYRMLETVREFGRLRLAEAGQESAARAAQRLWAAGYARSYGTRLAGLDQYTAVDALAAEETNLADELRAAIADGDVAAMVQMLGPLGLFWTIRGEHIRLLVLVEAVIDAVGDWNPPPDLADDARAAMATVLANSVMTNGANSDALRAVLRRWGTDSAGNPHLTGLIRVMLAYDVADPAGSMRRLEQLTDDDRMMALAASQWLCQLRENAGDQAGAIKAAERTLALSRPDDGPWAAAMAHTVVAQLTAHMGDRVAAVKHARLALPVLARLGAIDDELQLRSLLVLCAIADGRIADAQGELSLIADVDDNQAALGGTMVRRICLGELALVRGDHANGLRIHRECAAQMRELRLPGVVPTGVEPWILFGEAMALSTHAYYAAGEDVAQGQALFRRCRETALLLFAVAGGSFDYPAAGLLLFGLGAWALLRQAAPVDDALRLLALADRFSYTRTMPTMAWEKIVPAADEAAPGRIAELQQCYAPHEPADLVAEARRLAEHLP